MYCVLCLFYYNFLLCYLHTDLLHILISQDPWNAYNLSIKPGQ
jgi:hypothetical protein